MTPRVSDDQLSFARKLRSRMTTAETQLWRTLRNRGLGLKFRRQVPVGPYVADFACVAAKLVVELDGRPHEEDEQRHHDATRDTWLRQQGWTVLRVSNDTVLAGGDVVIDRIRDASGVPPSAPC